MDTNNQSSNTNPVQPATAAPEAQAPIPVAPNPEAATVVKSPPPVKSGGGSKKKLIVALLVVVILVVIAGIIGFYFMQMNNSKPAEVTLVPSVAPTEAPTPTVDPNAITDDKQLDEAIGKIENATDEANLTTEVDSLKKDANF